MTILQNERFVVYGVPRIVIELASLIARFPFFAGMISMDSTFFICKHTVLGEVFICKSFKALFLYLADLPIIRSASGNTEG